MVVSLLHTFEIAALAGGWTLAGHALLPVRIRHERDRALVWASAMALGAGVTAVVVTVLAILHAFSRGWVLVVAGAGSVIAVLELARLGRAGALSFSLPKIADRTQRVAFLALAVVLVLTLVATLAPPASMDATVYHLRVPSEFLRVATWTKLEETQSFQPLYVEMLFGEALGVGGGVVAALVHWALGLGAIAAAAAWARRLGGSAIWGAVIFGATALYVWESTSTFVDLGLALFSSLAFFWATRTDEGWQTTVLAGIFGGLAAGSKFTGLIVVALVGLAGFAIVWPEWRRGARRLMTIGILAMVVALPWYIRNLILTGNPIYPLANPLFGLPAVVFSSVKYGLGRDPLHLLTSAVDLIARGEVFDQGWSVGPAYLAFVPLGLAARRSRLAVVLLACIVAWWLVWFCSSPQTRLLLPIMPIAAGLASVGFVSAWSSSSRSLRLVALTVVAIAVLGALGTAVLAAKLNGRVVLGLESPAQYLERNSWNYIAYEQVNHLSPPDAKVAVTGVANNLYYMDREAIWLGRDSRSTAQLRAEGFTHELLVAACPLPSVETESTILNDGTYPLRASRLSGGLYMQVCYRISALGPARSGSDR
jgi:hypothetical protein